MKRLTNIAAIAFGLLYAPWACAQYVPPVEPLTPNSDHHNEDHSSHDHRGEDLHGILFDGANLASANFQEATLTDASLRGVDLTSANLSFSMLTRTDFSGARVTGTNFTGSGLVIGTGLSQAQLKSTASYESKDLHGIRLAKSNLVGWDFSGQNLQAASFAYSHLADANLSEAVVIGADFWDTTGTGSFSRAQLQSTLSFRNKDLRGINLGFNDLTGWDFSGQNLSSSRFAHSTMTGVDLRGANLKNADLTSDTIQSALFDSNTVYNQWTEFPEGFDLANSGITFVLSPRGDLDANDVIDFADVDLLQLNIRSCNDDLTCFPAVPLDLNNDGLVDSDDVITWIKDVKDAWFGDANLDGEFNSSDLVNVFEVGEYEDGIEDNSGWAAGDWNGDGDFTSGDLVIAFQDGGYEQGPRVAITAVPEPSGLAMLAAATVCVLRFRTRYCRTALRA